MAAPMNRENSREVSEDETEDPVDRMIGKTGCLQYHYDLKMCMADHQDWRKCQAEVETFKKCMTDYQNRKNQQDALKL